MSKKSIKKVLLTELRDFSLAALIAFIITFSYAGSRMLSDFKSIIPGLLFGFMLSISLWKGNQYLGWFVGRRFPWVANPKRTLVVAIVSSVIYSVIATILVYYIYLGLLLDLPFFSNIGRFASQIFFTVVIAIVITMTFYLAYFFKWWRISIVNEEQLKQEAIQLRYNALRNQVNPHFLFNSLSVLSALVDTDSKKAQRFIRKFSDIYRYVLEQRDKELVPLKVELDFIESFVDLNLVRHEDNLKVDFLIDNFEGLIVPMSLQILIENCLKHNVVSSDMPLEIKILREGDYIIVENKMQEKSVIQSAGGIGLETMKKRYQYLSSKPIIVDNSNGVFRVKIPILELTTNS